MSSPRDLLIVAGEASGDLHGARLLSELLRLRPDLHAYGLAGDELRAAGCEALAASSEISVVGITEALKILPRARAIFHLLLTAVEQRGTRYAVLIDSPDFNLRLAKKLKRLGVKVIYYISPQVWAWRRRRVQAIARDVELMLVLFPFELDFYRQHGVNAQHVGHPLVDEVPVFARSAASTAPPQAVRTTIALLPGSRNSEVRALLPVMLESVAQLAREHPLVAQVIQAPTIESSLLSELIAAAPLPSPGLDLEIVHQDRFAAIAQAQLALCASGTATLEVGLIGTPLIVLYRLSRWSYWLGKLLVKLPSFSMVNLVLDDRVVPELLQHEARPARIVSEARRLLFDPGARQVMEQHLGQLRARLGSSGASRRAALAVAACWRAGETP